MSARNVMQAESRAGGAVAAFAALGFLAAACIESIAVLGIGGPDLSVVVSLYGGVVLAVTAAVVILLSAAYVKRLRDRVAWSILGVGVLGAAIGDMLWARVYVAAGAVPFSEFGDAFYALEYAAVPVAAVLLVLGHRQDVEMVWPTIESGAVTALGMIVCWFAFVQPLIRPSAQPSAETLVDATYVLADFPLFVAPALLILITALKARDSRLLGVGMLLAGGLALIVAADTGWLVQRATTGWSSGSLVDFGFMGGHVLMATAALAYARTHRRSRERQPVSAASDVSAAEHRYGHVVQ